MEFTPWTLFVDLGLASLLLLVGQVLRARVRLVQKLFLPANVIGGGLGLALDASGLGWVPFSAAIGSYPGILIALIFVTLPFSAARAPRRAIGKNVAELFAYSTTTILLQWGLGLAFALGILRLIWSDLHPGFGAILASGFVGGHGTAAAIWRYLCPIGLGRGRAAGHDLGHRRYFGFDYWRYGLDKMGGAKRGDPFCCSL
jgi:ESS family glutamate:Na+ symporter